MPDIRLPDGAIKHFDAPVTVAELAASIGPGLAKAALAGRIVNVMAVAGILAADAVLRGTAVIVDRSDESQHDKQQPWTVFTGVGAPPAPALAGAAEVSDSPTR